MNEEWTSDNEEAFQRAAKLRAKSIGSAVSSSFTSSSRPAFLEEETIPQHQTPKSSNSASVPRQPPVIDLVEESNSIADVKQEPTAYEKAILFKQAFKNQWNAVKAETVGLTIKDDKVLIDLAMKNAPFLVFIRCNCYFHFHCLAFSKILFP